MTTPPLAGAITNKIPGRSQSVKWKIILKEIRTFSAYCCNIDSDGIMGVAKEPVVILSVSPNPLCTGGTITWDLTESYAPGSTITSWEIDFGDGGPTDSGASIASASGTHTYATAGTYRIRATIEEGTGLSQHSDLYLTVMDCGDVGTSSWTYISTYGDGVYFIDWTAASPSPEARNTGLEGNALNVNSMVIRPDSYAQPDTNHELWIATDGGVFKTVNGGREWAQMEMPDPANTAVDIPAYTADQLTWYKVLYDSIDSDIVYVLAGVKP